MPISKDYALILYLQMESIVFKIVHPLKLIIITDHYHLTLILENGTSKSYVSKFQAMSILSFWKQLRTFSEWLQWHVRET